MHVGAIGATGSIGQRIIADAARRGHHATGFTRDTSQAHPELPVASGQESSRPVLARGHRLGRRYLVSARRRRTI